MREPAKAPAPEKNFSLRHVHKIFSVHTERQNEVRGKE